MNPVFTLNLKHLVCLSVIIMIFLDLTRGLFAQEISFSSSGLLNENINNPTSLDFGPDGRLYVAQQNGVILAFEIQRNSAAPGFGEYSAIATEEITLVQTGILNHTDDGSPTTIKKRQVTGIKTAGTYENPVIYVTSSDSLIGGGGGINDKNLDTNSGMLSKLTWNGETWTKIDLVRGLPRCEENHSTNGMDIFEKNDQTYMLFQQGGHSNKGAPSNNFVGTPEYFLSAALLVVNLSQLETMPVYTDPRSNTQYIYDLPTLNDPNREDITANDSRFPYPSEHPLSGATVDVGDPFGGADGLNQAFAEVGGPVQVFSPGYRNAFDVVVMENGNIYTYDNGPNTGWGGVPLIYNAENVIKENQNIANYDPENGDYIKNDFNETGSSGHGDTLHFVGTINDPNGTYYGGHPNPIAAFPLLADLITYKNIDGEWLETSRFNLNETLPGSSGYFNSSFTLNDFPSDPRQGEYLAGSLTSDKVNILDVINSSTNGIAEYTASNFGGALKGNLLAASFNGSITRYAFTDSGDGLVEKEVIFNGFGATPLDVIALPDNHIYAGTVWAVTYGADNITIFEPNDLVCPNVNDTDFDPSADSDGDGYSNQDEIDSGTNFCSGGSTPTDNDNDLISDLNDKDDDNDGVLDVNDPFAIDVGNGLTTNLPINYPFWNNDPGTGFFGLGFTGLMLDPTGQTDYLTQFDENNLSFGGAAGKASIDLVTKGDPYTTGNSQDNGFQFGFNVDNNSPKFTVHSRLESPFFGINGDSTDPIPYQSAGIFIGNGDQDNYLKVVIGFGTSTADDTDGFEILLEDSGTIALSNRYDVPGLLDGNAIDIYINVSPADSTARIFISTDAGRSLIELGNPIILPESFLDSTDGFGMAAGLIATSAGSEAAEFSAIWDFLNVTFDQPGILETNTEENSIDFGALSLGSETAQLSLEVKNLSGPADEALIISDIKISGEHSDAFDSSLLLPFTLGPSGELIIPISFIPTNSIGEKNALLEIFHSGNSSPLTISLTGTVKELLDPLVRINAGGAFVAATDGGPDWLADNGVDISPTFSVNTGNLSKFFLKYDNRDSSIPDYIDQATYDSIFSSERWDSSTGEEMTYSIPVENGDYIVNLYLGNGYIGTSLPETRVFDVLIEDALAVDDLDLSSNYGHLSGGLIEIPVSVDDNELNIQFAHVVENPLINAIEILGQPAIVTPLALQAIPNQISDVGQSADFAVVGSGGNPFLNIEYSIEGQPDGIEIEPTNGQIFGTILESALDGGIAHDGLHTVTVSLSQNGLDSVSQEFEWQIKEADLVWIDKNESEDYVKRHECSFVQAGDRFIMFGGRESAQQLDEYDFKNDTWSQGGEAPLEFNHFQATNYEGLIWVIAAFQTNNFPNEVPAEHIYMYNPANQVWMQGREIPEDRRRGGAGVVVHDEKFYVVGGNTIGHNGGYVPWFDVYDPAADSWTALPDAPNARDHFHATIANGKLYAIGGRLSGGEGGIFAPLVPEVDVYDFTTQSWSTLTNDLDLPTPRAAPGVATLNNKIYVMGGEGEEAGPAYSVLEIFDPLKSIWTTGSDMNHPRHGTQAIVSGNGIYIAGGSPKRGGGNQHNMEVLGEDLPVGEPVIASKFSAQPSIIEFDYPFGAGSTDVSLVLENKEGNSATFVKSVKISEGKFELAEIYENILIKPEQSLTIDIVLTESIESAYSGELTVVYDNDQSISVSINAKRNNVETPIYKINVGGNTISETSSEGHQDDLSWFTDSIISPSPYVNAIDENRTYAVIREDMTNTTDYPSEIFYSTRYNRFTDPKNMQWDFPVENGTYMINLLFAEVWSGAASTGVRIFNINIENETVLSDFDIVEQYGWNTANTETFYQTIDDENIDIDLIKVLQNPQINGIEIIRLTE